MTIPWPPLHAYAVAHRCPTCKADPGQPCDAPRKTAGATREPTPESLLHAARQDAGIRHYNRDVAAAPWEEDREPGQRYDSLGAAWTPPGDNGAAHR
ncbi:hypothetical protein [Frankia sp. AgB32]|uniref:zinc finger domain-containing protein n=1 Tax=Frankia sp. AgB32 TaxID=631119 RepID=UPI00200D80DC|nr:hypothetical protein [Frankia sp. AgB32]MCK9895229.1 hypothetical protein [Frankia sp. AgB32]